MSFDSWVLVIGGLLLLMGLTSVYVSRLPFTPAMVYLLIGVALGPLGWAVFPLNPEIHDAFFYRGAEVTVVLSLFTVGLKLRLPLRDRRWKPTLLLAFFSMALTVALITATGVWLLHLPTGVAVLLGAMLAPTDPVLASEVQLKHAGDRDELRLALSGEGGFNDGTAFPFVMLGLGLLGLHDLGAWGWRWWTIDVLWAIAAGLALGGALGYAAGRLILYFNRHEREKVTLDEYILLGLIGLTYGLALKVHAYGFLAVFAAGLAVRAVERRKGGATSPAELAKGATEPAPHKKPGLAPLRMASALQAFNEQLERILQVGMVLLVGAGLFMVGLLPVSLWFVPLLLLVIRPLSVVPVWLTGRLTRAQFAGVAWFGIRGIGSIYYLMYALDQGLAKQHGRFLMSVVFTTVAVSIIVHGISVTPALNYLQQKRSRAKR